MTEEELTRWLQENPAILAYMAALISGALVSFFVVLKKRSRQQRIDAFKLSSWNITGLDFLIFLFALFIWGILSSEMLRLLHRFWFNSDNFSTGFVIASGMVFQLGMLYLFFRFKHHFRSANDNPISPRIVKFKESFKLGLVHFLAALPVIYITGMIWNSFLFLLRESGIEIEMPVQETIRMFQDSDNLFHIIGLIILATVVAPIVEELVFRAGIYRFFKGKTPIFPAMLFSSVLFGMVHWNLQSFPGLVAVGICLCLTYEWTGTIKAPIFFHALFNLNSVVWIILLPDGLI